MILFTWAGQFFQQFFAALPAILPRLICAWGITFVVLIYAILWLRKHIRPHVLRVDSSIRAWARTLRYRDVTATGPGSAERHARTWFFRFWTNFASAPTLIVLSLAVPIWATGHVVHPQLFYLPGLAYLGSMFLSFVSKRVFKRVRPQREVGAFGHKLKDGSFPSGHSLTSFCFWVMLAIAALLAGAVPALVAFLAIFAIVVIAFTGLSRVYLGVHFPTDVLGGYSIGLVWCLVCYFVLRPAL